MSVSEQGAKLGSLPWLWMFPVLPEVASIAAEVRLLQRALPRWLLQIWLHRFLSNRGRV